MIRMLATAVTCCMLLLSGGDALNMFQLYQMQNTFSQNPQPQVNRFPPPVQQYNSNYPPNSQYVPPNSWNFNPTSQPPPPQAYQYRPAPTDPPYNNVVPPINPQFGNVAPYENYQAANTPQTVVQQPPYNPNNKACTRFTTGRLLCTGSSRYECEENGCCWDEQPGYASTCFFHNEMVLSPTAPPPPPPSNPNPVPSFVPPVGNPPPPSGWIDTPPPPSSVWIDTPPPPPENGNSPPPLPPSGVYSPPPPPPSGVDSPHPPPPVTVQEKPVEPSKTWYPGKCLLHCTSIAMADRRICIPGDVGKVICTGVGCCYDELQPDPTKRCFHSNHIKDSCHAKQECNLPHGPKETCGPPGLGKFDCEVKYSCCYNKIAGDASCYKKQYGKPKTEAPETTTEFDVLKKLEELEAEIDGVTPSSSPQTTKKPDFEQPEIAPKAAGFTNSPQFPTQPPLKTYRPVYSTPGPGPVQYTRKCSLFGSCRLVPAPPTPQQSCFPRRCGDPVYTPDKIKNNFDARKIVGGSRAFPFSYPWTVMIQKVEGNRTFICGGTLICRQWLLTAAHCLDRQSEFKPQPDLDANMYKIFLGRWAGWQSTYGTQVQIFKGPQDIEMMFQHERFEPGKHRGVITHDIALMKLRKPVKLDDFTQPVCMPDAPAKPGEVMFATGWGVSKNRGPKPTTLKQVGLKIKSYQSCKDRVPGFFNPPGVICAGGEPDHDTCTGDSGGPMVGSKGRPSVLGTLTRPVWHLYGITSIGSPSCNTEQYDRQPALYTDVFYFRKWIETNTHNCCR